MSQEAAKRQRKQKRDKQQEKEETKTKTNPKGKKRNQPNHKQTNQKKCGQASGKPLFDSVVEGSDAESKVGQRLTGAPPWETQRGCTNELIGSDLVEHEKLRRHP